MFERRVDWGLLLIVNRGLLDGRKGGQLEGCLTNRLVYLGSK